MAPRPSKLARKSGFALSKQFKRPRPVRPPQAETLPVPVTPPPSPVIAQLEAVSTPVVLVPAPAPIVMAPVEDAPPPVQQAQQHTATLTTLELAKPGDRLKQSIEGFLLDQRSPHTRRAYGKDLKRFVQFLLVRTSERVMPESLSRSVLIAYKDSLLEQGLEHTTVDRHLATLRSFFRWLVDDGIIEKNPAEGVRFMNPRKLSTTIGFSDDEVRRILRTPNLHLRTGAQHYAILMVLFYCGLRRSELCELRTSSITVERVRDDEGVEREHRIIRLRGKGNSERIIAMVPAVWHALRHYFLITGRGGILQAPPPGGSGGRALGGFGDQPLFAPIRNNRTGQAIKPLDPSMIFYIVRKYARLAGIQSRVSPHSCRATAISNARDHNVPDRAIQEFAGWASPDMITRYDKRKSAIADSAAHAIEYGSEGEDRSPTGGRVPKTE